jgi:hypothetical protein
VKSFGMMRLERQNKRRRGEDWELILGVICVPALFLFAGLMACLYRLGISLPCVFRVVTGIPCPSCGATRCAALLLSGRVWEAWRTQPLVATAAVLGGAYSLYAFIVVIGRLPRPRPGPLPRRVRRALLAGALLAIAANWLYLIFTL